MIPPRLLRSTAFSTPQPLRPAPHAQPPAQSLTPQDLHALTTAMAKRARRQAARAKKVP